jgi:NitT/TauT family transport system substrate-binding protein
MHSARFVHRLTAASVVAALIVAALTGCSNQGSTVLPNPGPKLAPPAPMRLGILPTEDALPLWIAEQAGLFVKSGVSVKLVTYRTAAERDAAFKSRRIDGYVSDVLTVARLSDEGFRSRMVTLCLGGTPSQGRWGIVLARGERARTISQLGTAPVATSLGTLDEYVLDGLTRYRSPESGVRKIAISSQADRVNLLARGQIQAAVLGEPYLSLAIAQGARLVASDVRGTNLSQTVIAFSDAYLSSPEGGSAVDRLLGVWDAGALLANTKRKLYRPLLAEKANLPRALRRHYRMNSYPHHRLPRPPEVARLLIWMKAKKLLRTSPSFEDISWSPTS